MKKLIALLALPVIIFSSCKMKEEVKLTATQIDQVADTMLRLIPGTVSSHILQSEPADIIIILGSPSLYNAADDAKNQAAIRAGAKLLQLVGPDNCLKTGTLVIARKDFDKIEVPADGIKLNMKIDSLNKALFPAK
jgi:hypothetical protein